VALLDSLAGITGNRFRRKTTAGRRETPHQAVIPPYYHAVHRVVGVVNEPWSR